MNRIRISLMAIVAVILMVAVFTGCTSASEMDNEDRLKLVNVEGVTCIIFVNSGGSSVAIDCAF